MTQLNPPVLPPNNTSPAGRPLKPYRARRIQPVKAHGEQPAKRQPQENSSPDEGDESLHIDIEV